MVQMMKSSLMMCSMSKRFLFKMMISNKKKNSKKLLKKRTSKRFLKKRLSKKTSKR